MARLVRLILFAATLATLTLVAAADYVGPGPG